MQHLKELREESSAEKVKTNRKDYESMIKTEGRI
jgi:hypothetical protein